MLKICQAAHADHLDSLGLIEAFDSNSRAEGADRGECSEQIKSCRSAAV